jgi:hypothetical protein
VVVKLAGYGLELLGAILPSERDSLTQTIVELKEADS